MPCLVHDGVVINESNDICLHLEEKFPEPTLVPDPTKRARLDALLAENGDSTLLRSLVSSLTVLSDGYHMDVRNLTYRYILPSFALTKVIERAKQDVTRMHGEHKQFNEELIANNGITDQQIRDSIARFRKVLGPIDKEYATVDFLVENRLSLADIAFWCDIERLLLVGFPVDRDFPNMLRMFNLVNQSLGPTAQQHAAPLGLRVMIAPERLYRSITNQTLRDIDEGNPTARWKAGALFGLLVAVAWGIKQNKM